MSSRVESSAKAINEEPSSATKTACGSSSLPAKKDRDLVAVIFRAFGARDPASALPTQEHLRVRRHG